MSAMAGSLSNTSPSSFYHDLDFRRRTELRLGDHIPSHPILNPEPSFPGYFPRADASNSSNLCPSLPPVASDCRCGFQFQDDSCSPVGPGRWTGPEASLQMRGAWPEFRPCTLQVSPSGAGPIEAAGTYPCQSYPMNRFHPVYLRHQDHEMDRKARN